MEPVKITPVQNVEEIKACFAVMKELRPHLKDEASFIEQVQRQHKNGYHLVALYEGNKVSALVGYRFLETLAWGKFIYIDDLITHTISRKKGYGAMLLEWTIELAKKEGCQQVHLDSGYQRFDAHRLYLNQGFELICHHFGLKL